MSLDTVIERLSKLRFPGYIFVAEEYSIKNLIHDLRDAANLLLVHKRVLSYVVEKHRGTEIEVLEPPATRLYRQVTEIAARYACAAEIQEDAYSVGVQGDARVYLPVVIIRYVGERLPPIHLVWYRVGEYRYEARSRGILHFTCTITKPTSDYDWDAKRLKDPTKGFKWHLRRVGESTETVFDNFAAASRAAEEFVKGVTDMGVFIAASNDIINHCKVSRVLYDIPPNVEPIKVGKTIRALGYWEDNFPGHVNVD